MSSNTANRLDSRHRVTDSPSPITDYLCRGRDQMIDMFEDRPTRSLLACCAVGLGIGFLIGRAMGKPASSSSWFDRQSAERLGRQLMQRVEDSMPETVRDRLFK